MTLEFDGLVGWAISFLCLIAMLVGLLVIIDYLVVRGEDVIERARLKSCLTGDKLRFLIEENYGKENADTLINAITDNGTTMENFTMIIDRIKPRNDEPTQFRRVEQPA